MHVALFGGSFDPPHVGHQMAMLYALAVGRVERLLMVPAFRHAFDKQLSPWEHRLEMARRAAAPFGGLVEVSEIERRIGGASRTLHTVRALAEERPGIRIDVVIGADLLGERERWLGWKELEPLVGWIVVGRSGHPGGGGPALPEVSSTEVRERVRRGEPIDRCVPAAVCDYIAEHGLYREPSR
jgi:nicotinate-nucleotide adenylyltransferase